MWSYSYKISLLLKNPIFLILRLTHDISLDSLNDIDNDIALTPTTNGYQSWASTGPNHGPSISSNLYSRSVINANNVRNTDAHGQSSSWATRNGYNHDPLHNTECISDYTGRGCYHRNTECESIRRCELSDHREGVKRKDAARLLESDIDCSSESRRCYTTHSSVEEFDINGRQHTPEASIEEPNITGRCHSPHDSVVDTNTPRRCYSSQSSIDESETTRRRPNPPTSLEEDSDAAHRPLSRSSQEDDGGLVPAALSRRDSRASDSSYSDENGRRPSEVSASCTLQHWHIHRFLIS